MKATNSEGAKMSNYLRIVLPDHDGVKTGCGTKVYCGEVELSGVERIEIPPFGPDEIITATLTVAIDKIENLKGLPCRIVESEDHEKSETLDGSTRYYRKPDVA